MRIYDSLPTFVFSVNWKIIRRSMGVVLLFLLTAKMAFAAAGTDLLASADPTVQATFGKGSTFMKWAMLAEVCAVIGGYFLGANNKHPKVFLGVIYLLVFTSVVYAFI